jgi:hypothetical protein
MMLMSERHLLKTNKYQQIDQLGLVLVCLGLHQDSDHLDPEECDHE